MKKPLLLAALLCAAPALAELPHVSAGLGYAAQFNSARSYDLVDVDDLLAMYRVAAAASFELPVGFLDVEVGFQSGAAQETVHGGQATAVNPPLTTQLWLRGLDAGVRYRYPLFSHLQPYLHLAAGWDWVTLTVGDTTRLTQTVSNFAGSATVGVQVPIRLGSGRGRLPELVLDAGLGYTLRPAYGFTALAPEPPNGSDLVAHAAVNLGALPMSGLTYRLLLSFRY